MISSSACAEPFLPLGALAMPATVGSGLAPWLAGRLPGRQLALSANARTGIRQAVDRLGLVSGEEVLVPAWNCGSELDPLLHAGARVRLYPTDDRGRVSAEDVAARITPATRTVYVIHYFGWPQPEIGAIARLARDRGITLIEDCALALMTDTPEGPVGSFGDASVFCFYKFFPLIGGGALSLRSGLPPPGFDRPLPGRFEEKALARDLVRRLLGRGPVRTLTSALRRRTRRTRSPSAAPSGRPDMPEHYYFDPGFTDARISGITSRLLARIDPCPAAAARRRNFTLLADALESVRGAEPLFPDLPDGVVPLAFPVLVDSARRDSLCAELQGLGASVTPWWSGYHRGLDWSGPDLAPARALKDGLLTLPLHQYATPAGLCNLVAELERLLSSPDRKA